GSERSHHVGCACNHEIFCTDWCIRPCSHSIYTGRLRSNPTARHVFCLCAARFVHPPSVRLRLGHQVSCEETIHLVHQRICAGHECRIQYIFIQCDTACFNGNGTE